MKSQNKSRNKSRNKQTIILINGAKRSGKDHSARIIKDKLSVNHTTSIMAFADPIKQVIADTFNISLEELNDYKNINQEICIDNGGRYEEISDFRTIIQRFGNEAMKSMFGEKVWSNLLLDKALQCKSDFVIVPDFRFTIEEQVIIESDFNVITLKIKNDTAINEDTHASERELDNYKFDYIINNSGYTKKLDNYINSFISTKLDV